MGNTPPVVVDDGRIPPSYERKAKTPKILESGIPKEPEDEPVPEATATSHASGNSDTSRPHSDSMSSDASLSEFQDPYNHDMDYYFGDDNYDDAVEAADPTATMPLCFFRLPSFFRKRTNSFSAIGHDNVTERDGDETRGVGSYYENADDEDEIDDNDDNQYVSFDARLRLSTKSTLQQCWQTTGNHDSLNGEERPQAFLSSAKLYCNGINGTLDYTQEELDMVDGNEPTPESDLRLPRRYYIITTASIPWMTGTAVNPLLRAAYLSRRNRQLVQSQQEPLPGNNGTVTLVVPWLADPNDRRQLYGSEWADKTPNDQEAYIRSWLAEAARLPHEAAPPSEGGIEIVWYPARYHAALSSIFALGDLCEIVPEETQTVHDAICILEEPEHVNFYRAPGRESWRDKFSHVIGIVHTNYKAYVQKHYSGLVTGPLVGALSALMVQAYCDKVVKLSPVLQTYAPGKEVVSNVHGIRQEFFHVPEYKEDKQGQRRRGSQSTPPCYFVGKLLWAKGLDKLLNLESYYKRTTGHYFGIDIVGSGPEEREIKRSFLGAQQHEELAEDGESVSAARRHWRYFRQPIPARFLGRHDHACVGLKYKIFVNPSVTEVLCTTTVEAIAMGKWVIVPRHDSNQFMLQFPNCLQYKNKAEFCDLLQYALSHSVHQVVGHILPSRKENIDARCDGEATADRSHMYAPLTWEAATQRLVETGFLSNRDARRRDRLMITPKDRSIQEWHHMLGNGRKGDVIRRVLGGGPVAKQSPYKCSPSTVSLSSYTDILQ